MDNVKLTQNWSVPWGNSDDEALLIGIWKHGFGSWEEIQSDESLGLKGKFFLEAARGKDKQDTPTPTVENPADKGKKGKKASTPGAVHLVRRGDYLLLTLRESESGAKVQKEVQAKGAGPAEQAAARPKKPKAPSTAAPKAPASASTAAAPAKKKAASPPASARDSDVKPKVEQGTSKPKSKPVPAAAKAEPDASGDDSSSDDESDASVVDWAACKDLLRPVKKELKELKGSSDLPREEKVKILSRCLTAVGKRIDEAANMARDSASKDKQRRHLWKVTCGFWPMDGVQWTAIKAMCK